MTSLLALGTGFFAISSLIGLLTLVAFLAELVAFIDSLTHKVEAYPAAGKQTKLFWSILLGFAALVTYFTSVLGLLSFVGVVAVIVYFVDVRPALRAVRGGRNDRHMGPYGPW
jgi:uncharacterized membrane protein